VWSREAAVKKKINFWVRKKLKEAEDPHSF